MTRRRRHPEHSLTVTPSEAEGSAPVGKAQILPPSGRQDDEKETSPRAQPRGLPPDGEAQILPPSGRQDDEKETSPRAQPRGLPPGGEAQILPPSGRQDDEKETSPRAQPRGLPPDGEAQILPPSGRQDDDRGWVLRPSLSSCPRRRASTPFRIRNFVARLRRRTNVTSGRYGTPPEETARPALSPPPPASAVRPSSPRPG
jgi:hypothetical protein